MLIDAQKEIKKAEKDLKRAAMDYYTVLKTHEHDGSLICAEDNLYEKAFIYADVKSKFSILRSTGT